MANSKVIELDMEIKRSVVIQLKGNVEHISVSTFMELFGRNGPLEALVGDVDGVITESFKDVAFLLTLKHQSEGKIETIINHFKNQEVHFTSQNGNRMLVTARLPAPPQEIITLHPIPCYIDDAKIKALLEKNKWGKIASMDFGTHRNFKSIKNGWLNIYFDKININNIPKTAKICGKWVTITKPGESHLPLCRFCKERGHVQTKCPKKGFCTYCKTDGHILRNCRSKPTGITSTPWKRVEKRNSPAPPPIPSIQTLTNNRYSILQHQDLEINNMDKFPTLQATNIPTTPSSTSTPKKKATPKPKRTPKTQRRPITSTVQSEQENQQLNGSEMKHESNINQNKYNTNLPRKSIDNPENNSNNDTLQSSSAETPIRNALDESPKTTSPDPTEENIKIIEKYHEQLSKPRYYYSNIYEAETSFLNAGHTEPPTIRRSSTSLESIFDTSTTPSKRRKITEKHETRQTP